MKKITKTLLVLGIAALGATSMQAKDTLSFNISQTLTNDAVEPDATGKITANQNTQGNSSKSKLDIVLAGLTPSTDYSLVATVNDGSFTTTDLLDFTTDSKGKASLHLTGSSKGHGGGKNNPLPDGFDLSQVVELDVVNGSSQAVLSADTSSPTSLKYSVKRDLSANGVKSSLQIKTSKGNTKFTLTASGLDAGTDYQLVFNGTPVQTNTSSGKGSLKINLTGDPLPANILDLQTVELWDMANNVIVGTTTPLP